MSSSANAASALSSARQASKAPSAIVSGERPLRSRGRTAAKLRLRHSRYALRGANSAPCFAGWVWPAEEASAYEEASAAATSSRFIPPPKSCRPELYDRRCGAVNLVKMPSATGATDGPTRQAITAAGVCFVNCNLSQPGRATERERIDLWDRRHNTGVMGVRTRGRHQDRRRPAQGRQSRAATQSLRTLHSTSNAIRRIRERAGRRPAASSHREPSTVAGGSCGQSPRFVGEHDAQAATLSGSNPPGLLHSIWKAVFLKASRRTA
jgi:hypothetical protein